MKLLAIDTSTDACSVGLMVDDQVIVDHRVVPQQHGALLLPMVDALMAQAGVKATELSALIYGQGPGSFTGVRIGVATAQGIALGAGIGVIGISTLQSIAQYCYRQYGDKQLAVSVDARMEEVYFCQFQLDENHVMQALGDEQLAAPADLSGPSPCWAGSGAERYAHLLQVEPEIPTPPIRMGCLPHAADLLTIGAQAYEQDKIQRAEQASPVYLRNKVALTTAERATLKT